MFLCLLPLKLVLPDSLLYTVICIYRLMPLVFSYAALRVWFYSRVIDNFVIFRDPTVNSLWRSSGFVFITLGNRKEIWNERAF